MSSSDFQPRDSMWDKAVSVLLWIAGILWAVPSMLLLAVLWTLLDDPRKTKWLTLLQCRIQIWLTGCRWRAVVHPDVHPSQPYLFLQNHTNHFDYGVMAWASTGHHLQGVELEKHFKYPIYGWFMKSRGTIAIKQGSASANRDFLRRMREEVSKGMSILMFPEGTRTMDGRLGKLRRGAFHSALELGIPIVPVTVTGMYQTMHKGSLMIRPGYQVTVYLDKPIPTEGLQKKDVPALMEQVRSIMTGHLDAYWQEQSQEQGN